MPIQVIFNRKVNHENSSFQDDAILRAEHEFFNKEHFHTVAKNFYLTHVTSLNIDEISKFSDAYFMDIYDRPLIWKFDNNCIKFNSYYDYMSSFYTNDNLPEELSENIIHLNEFPSKMKDEDNG